MSYIHRQHHFLLLIAFFCLVSSQIFFQPANAKSDNGFKTQTLNFQNIPLQQTFNGIVEAVQKSTLSAEVSGRITEVMVDIDDTVKKGDVLLRIYNKQQQAGKKQAEATLETSDARLKEAKKQFLRIEKLYKEKQISKSKYDEALANYKSSKAQKSATQAGLSQSQEQLDLTVIRAPFNGVVIERFINTGDTVSPGTPLISGFSLDALRISVDIPQRLVNIIKQHHQATVQFSEQTISVSDFTIFPFAKKETGTLSIRIPLPKDSQDAFPGLYAKVSFNMGEQKQLLVPSGAIVHRSEVSGVYILKNGKVSFRHIVAGKKIAEQQIILSGVEAGEQVILDPILAGIAIKKQPKMSVSDADQAGAK